MNILIIDDDADLREILTTKLQKLGFNVVQASDGPSGIKSAEEMSPDMILLDVRMPGMSGVEVLSKMKANPKLASLKVFFLTNVGEAQIENTWLDEKFAKEAGALGFIKKTDDLDKIVERIKQELSV